MDSTAHAMIDKAGLRVAERLAQFLETQALPGTGIDPADFWRGAAAIYERFATDFEAALASLQRIGFSGPVVAEIIAPDPIAQLVRARDALRARSWPV